MWNMIWPVLLVVAANTLYNICSKSVPGDMNSFAALTVNYAVAAAVSLILFFVTNGGGKEIGSAFSKVNWAPIVMGLSIVGLELGYILIYRAGWKISTASLVANIAVACILIFEGVLLYKEAITIRQAVGIAVCVAGMLLIGT